jgi:hypothetical protein
MNEGTETTTMKTEQHELTIRFETHQCVDGPVTIGPRLYLGKSPAPMPPEAVNEHLRFGLLAALVFNEPLDDAPDDPVLEEIDRTIG